MSKCDEKTPCIWEQDDSLAPYIPPGWYASDGVRLYGPEDSKDALINMLTARGLIGSTPTEDSSES